MTFKRCTKCELDKPLSDFKKDSSRHCGSCIREQHRTLHARHREREPVKWLLTHTRCRAKSKNVPFTLTAADISIPEFCPVLGIPLRCKTGGGMAADDSPSLDRFIPELGYVPGNVEVISNRANRIKSNASADEVEKVALWMRARGAPACEREDSDACA